MPRLSLLLKLPSRLRRKARRSRMLTLLALLAVLVLFVYPFYAIYKPPRALIRYFQNRWPEVLWEVQNLPPGQKVVALTIDDAPSRHTQEILDVLKENGAKATFFVIGNQVLSREEIMRSMVREGMELGNHAMRDEPSQSLPLSALEKEILSVNGKILSAYESVGAEVPKSRYFRPGSGFFNRGMLDLVTKMGYRLVLGSVYPHDPQIGYPSVNARHILSMVHPGAVIICHDRRSWTAPMLRKVLPELKRRGYEVVTVSELLRREVKGPE